VQKGDELRESQKDYGQNQEINYNEPKDTKTLKPR